MSTKEEITEGIHFLEQWGTNLKNIESLLSAINQFRNASRAQCPGVLFISIKEPRLLHRGIPGSRIDGLGYAL